MLGINNFLEAFIFCLRKYYNLYIIGITVGWHTKTVKCFVLDYKAYIKHLRCSSGVI